MSVARKKDQYLQNYMPKQATYEMLTSSISSELIWQVPTHSEPRTTAPNLICLRSRTTRMSQRPQEWPRQKINCLKINFKVLKSDTKELDHWQDGLDDSQPLNLWNWIPCWWFSNGFSSHIMDFGDINIWRSVGIFFLEWNKKSREKRL